MHPKNNGLARTTALTCLGAGFEYYDFVVYAMLAPWLAKVFFPQPGHILHLIQVFAIFASGYLIRPCGGIFFGRLGDLIGRKKIYCIVVTLMALSTLAIALLPGYQKIGIAAPICLLLLRLIQGASLGAELPGSLILLAEHAPAKRRGFLCGLQIGCIGLGAALATFLCGYVQTHFAASAMQQYGWRLPFIIGSLLALVAAVARYKVAESPIFIKEQQRQQEIKSTVKVNLWQQRDLIIKGLGMLALPASLVMTALSLPTLFSKMAYSASTISHAMTVGYLWCSVIIPLWALAADRIGRNKLLKHSSYFGCIIFCLGLICLKSWHSAALVWAFILILQTWQASLSACYFTKLAELFPTAVRFRGYAFSYNIIYAICGLIPMLIAWQSGKNHFLFSLGVAFVLLAIICQRAVTSSDDLTGSSLETAN